MIAIGLKTCLRRLSAIGLAAAVVTAFPTASAERLLAGDDPFADELNPFGTGRRPAAPAEKPPAVPTPEPAARPEPALPPALPQPSSRPRATLPVPFPESRMPDDQPGRRPAVPDRDGAVERPGRGRGVDAAAGPEQNQTEAEQKLAEAANLERQGKLDEARAMLRDVVQLDPMLTMGHLALGVVQRRLGDYRGSIDACTRGIEIDPEEPELFLRRGIAWFHLGLYGIALEDFEEAAGMAYDDPRPELWRGLTLIELDRPLEAINAYASAIRRDRTCMLAYLNRGLAYLSADEPRKAEFDFNQAIRQKPKDVRAWANRGVAQARQGRFREAIESYETALGISPGDQAARRNLEAARRMVGQESRARAR